jgi:uracil-DNA glycosylase family 4
MIRRAAVDDEAGARAVALARLMAEHRACTRCADAGFIPQARPVFSGRFGQRIMLVGQAPGVVEHDITRPFAGRAGRQLVRWMVRAGFADEADFRNRVYVTSTTTCFPGRRPDGSGDRRPTPAEIDLCAPWLDGVRRLLAPRLIIPVGGLAASRFLPRARLADLIGRTLAPSGVEVGDPHGAEPPLLLPLPHPSGQSRWLNDPAQQALLATALERLRSLVNWAEAV